MDLDELFSKHFYTQVKGLSLQQIFIFTNDEVI
jgi:hypothetical protein